MSKESILNLMLGSQVCVTVFSTCKRFDVRRYRHVQFSLYHENGAICRALLFIWTFLSEIGYLRIFKHFIGVSDRKGFEIKLNKDDFRAFFHRQPTTVLGTPDLRCNSTRLSQYVRHISCRLVLNRPESYHFIMWQ